MKGSKEMITTKRLQLVPIEIKYAKDLLALWSDYEVVKYTYNPWCKTIEDCEARIEHIQKFIDPLHMNNWVILHHNELIGVAGVPTVSDEKGEYGLYYQLCQNHWGKGFGFEVAKALVDELFENTKAIVILADAVTVNPASMRILEKVGMKQTHLEEKSFQREELVGDLMHYQLTREEWEESKLYQL